MDADDTNNYSTTDGDNEMDINKNKKNETNDSTTTQRRDGGKTTNQFLLNYLNVAYSKRPNIPENAHGYVEPKLFGFAHEVFQHPTKFVNENNTVRSIYVGPKTVASPRALGTLKQAGIVGIVNCTNVVPCYHRDNKDANIRYCQVAVNDVEGADILTYLDGATSFIHYVLEKEGSVLVHCEQGMSRSSTVVIAYLMRFHNMSRDGAYIHCKTRRPVVSPNEGFWKQLEKYERTLKATTTTTPRQQGQTQKQSSDENGKVVVATTIAPVFDSTWALKTNALFGTCREIPELLQSDDVWKQLETLQTEDDVEKVLSVSLDFIWGRGILEVDVAWLCHICSKINATTIQPSTIIEKILHDPESDFGQDWAGEIYPEDVKRVISILNSKTTSV